ncbi:MAG: mechanosensitive ion channel family protein [bacterium]
MNVDVKFVLNAVLIGSFSFVLFLVLRALVFKVLKRIKKATGLEIYDFIIKIFKIPSLFWVIALSINNILIFSEIPEKYSSNLSKVVYVFLIFSFTYAFANLIEQVLRNYVNKLELPITPTGIVYGVIKGLILVIGFLIILSVLNISILPILTSLGIGGLAVALALQDTLSNLFAGIHILAEKSIRVGDFVRLENGQEGYVEEIGWRTTKIRMLSNNLIIIPNSKLAQSIVVNFHLPEKRMSLLLPISVSYNEDPDRVEKVILEEAIKAADEVEGLLKEPPPFVRFNPGFGESSLDFTLICQIREFSDQGLILHTLRKRIFKRFKEEGIEIPFPHRIVYLKNEKMNT